MMRDESRYINTFNIKYTFSVAVNLFLVCSMCIPFVKCDRHEDLKQMLDSSKDNLKLEAMKRIIGVSNTACIFMH